MTKNTRAPKRHADHITETIAISDRVKRTIATDKGPYKHAVWVDGAIVATAHKVGPAWSVVTGDCDGDQRARKFAGIAQTEAEAITALENAARKLAAVA